MADLYQQLRSAVALEGDRAVLRIRTTYQPAGGPGARIYPPTYPSSNRNDPPLYVIEDRFDGGKVCKDVLLDSVPSQANRAEEALLRAHRAKRIQLPLLEIDYEGGTLTSLELPHRYADAYLLDSEIDGVNFDRTDLGKAFRAASPADATALYCHDPGSLVFGAWNSHRKGRQMKFPRIYASEIVGWDPEVGQRRAGRMDSLNLTGTGHRDADGELVFHSGGERIKGNTLAEIGLGNIPPNPTHGGVTVSSAERFATLSLAAIDRLGFGTASEETAIAARTVLAAYALVADRLAFGKPSVWLRSGCELVTVKETLEWVDRGGKTEEITLTADGAISLFERASAEAQSAGLPLNTETVHLTPGKGLAQAIEFALTRAETTDD